MIIKATFGDREVSFCTSFAWALKYSSQFKRDAMRDLAPAFGGNTAELSLDTIARVAWSAAALCDPDIEPDLMKWVMSLGDDFNYSDIVSDVIVHVIEASINSKKSKAPEETEETGAETTTKN